MRKIKLIQIILAVCLIGLLAGFAGCSEQGGLSEENPTDYDVLIKNHKVIEIDSCEYIVYSYSKGYAGYGFMAHKGNCKYCEQRKANSR